MPKAKPKPPPKDDFASVLKTVENLKETPRPPKEEEPSPMDQVAAAVKQLEESQPERQTQAKLGQQLTISEHDSVRQQIEQCSSEERCVGKEWGITCRSRWARYH